LADLGQVLAKGERGMPQPHPTRIPRKKIRIDCGAYLLRTLTIADASDRWAGWMDDPKNLRLLNSPARSMTKDDIVSYIKQFDQQSHLLIGIFEKQTGLHLGFFRIDIDPVLNRCLVFLIGEPKHRHSFHFTNERMAPFFDFIFETLGLNTMLATVLASNRALTNFLLRNGWSLDKTLPRNVKSQSDGTMLDLCYFSFSREAWHARKTQNALQNSVD
jgi:RimJ/RimL family protein N-acetyltransferase